MSKPMLFISHAQIDTLFAKKIKSIIRKPFAGAFEIFVSSEENSINLGANWIDKIFEALDRASCMISLCSPTSISRPWIPFELGYICARKIPCIPICIRGLTISTLPTPLSHQQRLELNTIDDFNILMQRISKIYDLDNKKTYTKKYC